MNFAYDKELDYNYLTLENNAKIISFSSQTKGCPAINVISNDRKAIWLSENSIPQYIIIDTGNFIKKPKTHFKYFGIYCWHAYSTNPKIIELQFSKDGKNFISFGKYELTLKPGTQFLEIKNNKLLEFQKYRYFKIVIKETYGGNRTYLNQIYLFEELSGVNNSTMNSCKNTQITEVAGKRLKSEHSSLFIGEEEDEIIEKIPTEMERSKLIMCDLNDDENDEYDSLKKIRNKKLSKIENILKNKIKNNTPTIPKPKKSKIELSENESLCDNDAIIDRKQDYNQSKCKNSKKLKLNNSYTFENDEYQKLENQLKEMEDHLKSMGADFKFDAYKTFNTGSLSHSRSFSFIHNPNRERDSIYSSNIRTSNPFINNNIINTEPTPLKNNYYTVQNEPMKTNPNTESNLELKILNIENKINKFENELCEMKDTMNKLLDNMNRLIDGGGIIPNNSPIQSNNEIVSLILNECNKIINEKLNQGPNNSYYNNTRRSSAKKSKIVNNNYEGEYDYNEDLSINQSKKY